MSLSAEPHTVQRAMKPQPQKKTPVAAIQAPNRVRCPKCGKPLKSASTFRLDGNQLTCTNKVRDTALSGTSEIRTTECGAKVYLLIGPQFVVTALLDPDQFRELQSLPDSGDPMVILEWLGLAGIPLMPAA